MCGIAGIYRRDGVPIDAHTLRAMTDLVRHRGPDDDGYHLFSLRGQRGSAWRSGTDGGPTTPAYEGGLGFRRLSILDLSANGHQPMSTPDGRVTLVLNGEIYNAFELLRPALEAEGFRFKSNSDTEVVLYLYVRHGFERMLSMLNGMFAICLVDLARGELHIARDRLGIKPLYWYERDGLVLFASEVKAFLAHPEFRAEPEVSRLDEYFLFRSCAEDGFLLKGVRQLEPGTRLVIGADGVEKHAYWRPPDVAPSGGSSFGQALDRLDEELRRSVRMQLLSDVKLGCQLSGGVDSTLVNLFATRYGEANMDAFSILFDDPRITEEEWIRIAVDKTGVVSHTFTLNSDRFIDQLERATWHLDQPLAHPNSIGIYYIAQEARKRVTVLLSGEGADELFGGYYRYFYAVLRQRLGPALGLASRLPVVGQRLAQKFGDPRTTDHVGWFVAQSAFGDAADLRSARPDARPDEALARRRALFPEGGGGFLARCLNYDLRTYLDPLLVRQDKMTMAHSVENRVPFLDHELVEFVRTLPTDYLVRLTLHPQGPQARGTKVLLKHLALRYFDREFVYRPKMGFEVPVKQYLTHPRLREIVEERLLPGMKTRGYVDARVVERWWRSDASARSRVWDAVWGHFAFELWAEQFLDGKGYASSPSRPLDSVGAAGGSS